MLCQSKDSSRKTCLTIEGEEGSCTPTDPRVEVSHALDWVL